MKKRILSMVLVLVMIFSLVQVTALADDETATTPSYVTYDGKYAIVDLQGNGANAQIYNTTGVYYDETKTKADFLTGFTYSEYLSKGYRDATDYGQGLGILNKTAVDAQKDANDYIYAANGTPFKFATDMGSADAEGNYTFADNGILLGAKDLNGIANKVTLNLPKDYMKLSFVEASMGASEVTLTFNVKYKDEAETLLATHTNTRYFIGGGKAPAGYVQGNVVGVSSINCFTNTSDNTKLGFQLLNGVIANSATLADREYYPGVVEVALDPSKEVEYVTISSNAPHGSTAILAMTAIKGTDEEIVADALKKLPADVTTITAENYANYTSAVAVIDAKIEAGYVLSSSDLAKFNAVKNVVEYYANRYQIINMTSVANGTTYVTVTDAGANKGSVAGIADMRAPQYFGHRDSTPVVVLSKTAMDNAKDAKGLIYAADGTPFNFRTELTDNKNTINLGGNSEISGRKASATVPVSGNLASIDVVLLSTGVFEKYAADTSTTSGLKDYADDTAFKATVYYTDGSFKEDANLKSKFRMKTYYADYKPFNTTDLQTYADTEGYANVKSQITAFGKASATKSKVLIHNYDDALNENKNVWYGSNIPTYSIETDAAKTVEKVVFTGPTTRAMVSILAMTAVKASPEDVFAGRFENLPADAITEANYKTYLSLYNNIESGIVAGYEIPAEYADAYEAFAEEMSYYINRYTIIDMTSVANGTMYGTPEEDGSFPGFVNCSGPEYLSINNVGGLPRVVLNRTAMNGFKDTDGLIYADDGVPFNFRTEEDKLNTINIGGISTLTGRKTEVEVPVNGNFTSIDLVALSTGTIASYRGEVDGVLPEYNDDTKLVAEIHYEGGEVEVSDFHGKFMGWEDKNVALDLENVDTAAGFTQPKSQFSQFAKANTDLRIKEKVSGLYNDGPGVEQSWGTAVPTYSIETDPAKTVEKIVFKNDLRCMISILAMTAVNDPRSVVETEPAAAPTVSVEAIRTTSDGKVPKGSKVTLTTETEDATIYYTTDGTEPTTDSAVYEAPIEITADTTIRAIAGGEGFDVSEEATFTYAIFLNGDIQVNGIVNAFDLVFLKRALAKWPANEDLLTNLDLADINGDGKVNAFDGVHFARAIAKWPVEEAKYLPYYKLND